MNLINSKIVSAAKKMLLDCMGAKPGENVLIVCDEKKIGVAYSFAHAGREAGLNVTLVEGQSQTKGDVPPLVAGAMLNADVALIMTSMSYSHTAARGAATKAGVRIATMPMLTEEIAENYLDADYTEIAKLSIALKEKLDAASVARVTSPWGTDLTMNIKGREAMADYGDLGKSGDFGNLPAGEACLAPLEDDVNGVFVMQEGDCVAYLGYVKDTLTLTVEHGKITKIEGDRTAQELRDFLKDKDEGSVGIAELGIGTNGAARLIGHPLLDEKVLGTIHIAFGNSIHLGGVRDSNIHYDCVTRGNTVYLDDVCVMKDGTLL